VDGTKCVFGDMRKTGASGEATMFIENVGVAV